MSEPNGRIRMPRWAWTQLVAGAVCLGPVVWSSHFYVAHSFDEVSVAAWVGTAILVGILWGPLLIMTGAVLLLMPRARRTALAISISGCIQSGVLYSFGVWVFTFRYPPVWWIAALECAAAAAAFVALIAAAMQAPMREGFRCEVGRPTMG